MCKQENNELASCKKSSLKYRNFSVNHALNDVTYLDTDKKYVLKIMTILVKCMCIVQAKERYKWGKFMHSVIHVTLSSKKGLKIGETIKINSTFVFELNMCIH